MTSMNISIKKEAYDFLRRMKTRKRSFSDVILSFKNNEQDTMRFFGILKDADWKEKEKSMKEFKDSWNARLAS